MIKCRAKGVVDLTLDVNINHLPIDYQKEILEAAGDLVTLIVRKMGYSPEEIPASVSYEIPLSDEDEK